MSDFKQRNRVRIENFGEAIHRRIQRAKQSRESKLFDPTGYILRKRSAKKQYLHQAIAFVCDKNGRLNKYTHG